MIKSVISLLYSVRGTDLVEKVRATLARAVYADNHIIR